MKKIVPIVLTFGICAGAPSFAVAQTPVAEPVVAPNATNNWLGKPLGGWIIPGKYWTNAPAPVWLGSLRGEVTVVEFFRINCSHCQDAAPSRRLLYKRYGKQGLKMVGFQSPGVTTRAVNDENDWAKVKAKIKDWGLEYPIAFDKDRALFDKNEFLFYPTVLVLDGQGIVRFQQTGYSPAKARQLEAVVSGMLKSS